jgi:hypothetical protein
MASISREHRKLLETAVVAARHTAERGAEKALTSLGVGDRRSPDSATEAQRSLRKQLRAHGHQLGDVTHANGEQSIDHLKQACAYEHWHRMIFARFLAENDLLISPDYGVAMSFAEIQETARGKNRDWLGLASEYAQRMLLSVFRPDDPVLRLPMPPETDQALEELLLTLPAEIFTADDSLGWVYQFWQRDEKTRVNKSELAVGADELSPVTQLFTDDYMVLFLLHNTLGAWWASRQHANGKTHELPGYEWTYLRLTDRGSPAAGSFDRWPRTVRELRILDPCMGSGHFLIFALPILARMRHVEEGLSMSEAVSAVLKENLFGLELDARCSQIAAFNLALTSWRLVGRPVLLPQMNLACSGLGINASKQSWIALGGSNQLLRDTLAELYSMFEKAPTLGSLIDPARAGRPLLLAKLDEVWPLIEQALSVEQRDEDSNELAIAARGLLTAARFLVVHFTLVTTNVPYLGRWRQATDLAGYCKDAYPDASADLAASFIDRCLRFCRPGGSIAIVTKQEPLFLGQYKHQRERLLRNNTWEFVIKLGPRAFEAISGERVTVALLCLTQSTPPLDHAFVGIDVGNKRSPSDKATSLQVAGISMATQRAQLANPDSRVMFEVHATGSLLKGYASGLAGQLVGDSIRFERSFWEVPVVCSDWEFLQSTVDQTKLYGGKSNIILWEQERGQMYKLAQSVRHLNHVAQNWLRGKPNWGKSGVIVNLMGSLSATLYLGHIYDCNCCAIVPHDEENLAALWAYCSSREFAEDVRRLDQKIAVQPHTLLKVSFDIGRWLAVAEEMYPDGLPTPTSDDPSQWIFDGRPEGSTVPLQVAVSRLVGYRWPRQTGSSVPDCPALEPDGLEGHADADGIVCLSSISGKPPAADRVRAFLADAYDSQWSASKLTVLLGSSESLEAWLRDKFFEDHCALFESRPFVWQVWDGRKDGFHAFVNYHKLAGPKGEGRKTLEKLIYTYLGDWIRRQRDEVSQGRDAAEARLAAALHLHLQLEKILEGQADPALGSGYDIFIRWKPLHEQPVGWEPDLNDGVRLNMRPWLYAKPYQEPNQRLRQGACILRVTPIKMPLGKDRGKEPSCDNEDFPWFAASQDRTNDEHYTLEQKRAAKERKKRS